MSTAYLGAARHYKDIAFGKAEAHKVPLSYGDFHFMNTQNLTWCDVIAKLSMMFMNAELKSRLTMMSPVATFGFSDYYRDKFKEDDQETRLERLEFVLGKMKSPTNGLAISLYEIDDTWIERPYTERGFGVTWPFHTLQKWDFADTWSKDHTEEYISVQLTEKNSVLRDKSEHMAVEDKVLGQLVKSGIRLKFVSYDQTSQYVYDTILNARCHVSYCGSSWWLAHALHVPVYSYGHRYSRNVDLWGKHTSGLMSHSYNAHVPVTVQEDRFVNRRVTGPGWSLDEDSRDVIADLNHINAL